MHYEPLVASHRGFQAARVRRLFLHAQCLAAWPLRGAGSQGDAMQPLQDKMREDLELRGRRPQTIETYIR